MKYYIKEYKICVNNPKSIYNVVGVFVVDFDKDKIYPIREPNYDYEAVDKLLAKKGLRKDGNHLPFYEFSGVENQLRQYFHVVKLDINYKYRYDVLTEKEAFIEGL